MVDIFGFFQKKRIKRTKQEIKLKEQLIETQGTLNSLLREEKEIESA